MECEYRWQSGWVIFQPEQRQALFERIHASGAQIVTVAMGSPKQEIFMRDCRLVHPDALYMGVGGTYDVFTGHVKRAPKIWQTLGLEWLYRLLSQPSRIKRQLRLLRYLQGITPATSDFPLFVKRRSGHFVACLLFYYTKHSNFYALFAISPELRKHSQTLVSTHNDNR